MMVINPGGNSAIHLKKKGVKIRTATWTIHQV